MIEQTNATILGIFLNKTIRVLINIGIKPKPE